MPEWILWAVGILIFVVIIMVSVGLHEAGHLVAAKKLGIAVPEFFVGFGKKLFSFKKGPTEYGMRAIPLGGYVRVVDETVTDEDDPAREMLSNVAPWKRQIIFAAGPLVNIVLGFAILMTYLVVTPYSQPSTTVDVVNVCSAENEVCGALEGGLKPGDEFVSIDGVPVESHSDITSAVAEVSTADVVVLRDGKEVTLAAVAVTEGRLGINVAIEEVSRTPGEAFSQVNTMIGQTVTGILTIPEKIPGVFGAIVGANERDPESPGSVVGMGRVYGEIASTDTLETESKIGFMVLIAGALNLSLGFLNLLPIGMLDGSKMLFAFVDSIRIQLAKIRKKTYTPTPYVVVKWVSVIPMFALFAMMALLIVADIIAPLSILG